MSVYLRTSERNLFKKCQWQWERAYIDKLKPKGDESLALWFGTGIHAALEAHYSDGDMLETWKKYCDDEKTRWINPAEEMDTDEAIAAAELGEAMLSEYLKFYKDEEITPLLVEYPFQIKLNHSSWENNPKRKTKTSSTYVGTIDLVYRDGEGRLWLMDHKTARALGSANTTYLPLDDQAGAYLAFAEHVLKERGLIEKHEHIQGITYNYLVKKMPDPRPVEDDGLVHNKPQKKHFQAALSGLTEENLDKMTLAQLELEASRLGVKVLGDVSKNQPTPMFERIQVFRGPIERQIQIRRIGNDLEAMSLVRNGLIKSTKSPGRDCSFCPFAALCRLDERQKDWRQGLELGFTTWNPYEGHIR